MRPPLTDAVSEVAPRLPPAQVRGLASALENEPDPFGVRLEGVATPTASEQAHRLLALWEGDGETDRRTLATALRTAARTVERLREDERIEVVWTGPETIGVATRATSAVLAEVIAAARHELLLVSFAAYRVPSTSAALLAALDRGVRVDLVLETADDSAGRLDHDASTAFTALGGQARIWHWPTEARPRLPDGRAAVLHAKAVLADSHQVFVTSANLTRAAAHDNLELGLLVTGGGVPRRIGETFVALRAAGRLKELSVRKAEG